MLTDIAKRRFITMGVAAWLLLLPLAPTSTNWAIRKLGGKSWNRLHKLVYVAAICGIIHYWWQVKPGVLSPLRLTIVIAVLLAGETGAGVDAGKDGAVADRACFVTGSPRRVSGTTCVPKARQNRRALQPETHLPNTILKRIAAAFAPPAESSCGAAASGPAAPAPPCARGEQ